MNQSSSKPIPQGFVSPDILNNDNQTTAYEKTAEENMGHGAECIIHSVRLHAGMAGYYGDSFLMVQKAIRYMDDNTLQWFCCLASSEKNDWHELERSMIRDFPAIANNKVPFSAHYRLWDLGFRYRSDTSCRRRLIRHVRGVAFAERWKPSDLAAYGGALMRGADLIWHAGLDEREKEDWSSVECLLLRRPDFTESSTEASSNDNHQERSCSCNFEVQLPMPWSNKVVSWKQPGDESVRKHASASKSASASEVVPDSEEERVTRSYLRSRSASVQVAGTLDEGVSTENGIPQASIVHSRGPQERYDGTKLEQQEGETVQADFAEGRQSVIKTEQHVEDGETLQVEEAIDDMKTLNPKLEDHREGMDVEYGTKFQASSL